MSSQRRKSLNDYDANGNAEADIDDADANSNYFSNGSFPTGLRRRHSSTRNIPDRSNDEDKKRPNAFPKGLTPFFNVQEVQTDGPLPAMPDIADITAAITGEGIEGILNRIHIRHPCTPPRSASPKQDAPKLSPSDIEDVEEVEDIEDIEQQAIPGNNKKKSEMARDISFNNNFNTTTGSETESFNNSGISNFSDENYFAAVTNLKMGNITDDSTEGAGGRSNDFNYSDRDYSDHDPLSDIDSIDSESKEESVRADNCISRFQRSRRFIGKLVNNEYVQIVIIFLIVINAIMMGIATDPRIADKPSDDKVQNAFKIMDSVFLYIFTAEIAMQLYYYGLALFLDAWLVFDLIVIISSYLFSGSGQVVRAFRIFRAFRLVSRLKPLRDLVIAVGDVMPRLMAIFCLLGIVFFIFAVLFTELYGDLLSKPGVPPDTPDYFGTLQLSAFTCFQMMTMEWGEVCRILMSVSDEKTYYHAWMIIIPFVFISGFIVFNLIVAVVVEAVATTEETIRVLDGKEDNSPQAKLDDAQERIQLLTSHLKEMMNEQEQIQFMLEAMSVELLHLETERMKAKRVESLLWAEIGRRTTTTTFKKKERREGGSLNLTTSGHSPATSAIATPRKKRSVSSWLIKPESLKTDPRDGRAVRSSEDLRSLHLQSNRRLRTKKRRSVSSFVVVKPPAMKKDSSGKSLATTKSGDSNKSPKSHDGTRRVPSTRHTISSLTRTFSGSEKHQRARDNWKKMLAIQSSDLPK